MILQGLRIYKHLTMVMIYIYFYLDDIHIQKSNGGNPLHNVSMEWFNR